MSNQDFQTTVLLELGEIKALCATNTEQHKANEKRIVSLENTNTRQWWIHGIQAALVGAFGLAKKLGVI